MIENNFVYFVGSGPGDPELITIKAKNILENADIVIYSGSLLNPEILRYAKKDAMLYDAALLDREEIFRILRDNTKQGKLAIRFHDGDPGLFSTIREQIDKLEKDGVRCKVIPGITQTVIITRAEFRTPVPDREKISELAKHGATMVFYLSVHLIKDVVAELLKGGVYTAKTPVAIIYKATWKEEKIIKTALIIVGDVIQPSTYQFSKVYDSGFTHGYRKGRKQ